MKNCTETLGEHAIIIGGSIAGKLAACVLSEYFTQVTIIEKDPNPIDRQPRKGVPQENHNHLLLKGGELALEALFPGLMEELKENGAVKIDIGKHFKWFHHGYWKVRFESGVSMLIQSRAFLERHILQRIEAYDNIQLRYGAVVESYLTDESRQRISGVQVKNQEGSHYTLSADLVVDAGGAGSMTPQWLKAADYHVHVDRVKIDLGYASRRFEKPVQDADWLGLAIHGNPPYETRGGVLLNIEENQIMVSLYGYLGDYPPHREAEFLQFARSLTQPDIYERIKDARPLSEIKVYRFPMMYRHGYEKMKRFPNGLIVMGDAFCRFDPVFGQGMTVAALESLELRSALETVRRNRGDMKDFSKTFHKKIAKIVNIPWSVVKAEAFRYPKTEGKKPPGLAFTHWYNRGIFRLSAADEKVYNAFIRVMTFIRHPLALFHPSIVTRVIRSSLRKRP